MEELKDLRAAIALGSKNGSMVYVDSTEQKEAKRKRFHTTVAKLLYLSTRVRRNIISVISFLCTTVKNHIVEDQKKLVRLLGYLKGTREQVMKMKASGVFMVVVCKFLCTP